MSILRKYLMGLIILILVLYTALALYLKILATLMVDHAMDAIKKTVPAISEIQYDRIHFYPYDFFNKTLHIDHLNIRFKDSNVTLKIDQVTLHHFMSLRTDSFGSFDLSMTHLQMSSLPDLVSMLSAWNTNLPVAIQGISLPSGMSLTLSATANYDAPAHTLQIALNTQSEPNFLILNDQIILNQINLNRSFFSKANFIQAMNAASIDQINYHTDLTINLPVSILQNSFPLAGNFLQNLGYTTLPISLQADTQYHGNNHTQTGDAHLSILNLGQFNANWDVLVTTPPSAANFAQLLIDPNALALTQAESTPNLVQSAQISFTDQSFMNRFFQFLASNTNQSVAAVQSAIQTELTTVTQNLQIPQLTAIVNTVNNFVANPSTLVIRVNPIIPFTLTDITTFFNAQQSLKMGIQQTLSTTPATQKAALFNHYESTSIETYSNFFNKIGLNVSADGIASS
ncbi:MAG: hypothetical protein NTV32_02460 [Gammaproteobacteria bacterium]|nr:hypothetical protein [Gammaproteobacteria bacterium]